MATIRQQDVFAQLAREVKHSSQEIMQLSQGSTKVESKELRERNFVAQHQHSKPGTSQTFGLRQVGTKSQDQHKQNTQ